ncbi:flavin reductase [Micromonospora sp. DT81.3]
MMDAPRRVAIVGAGEAGAQLALKLQSAGVAVVLFSDRSAEQIRTGSIMSSQCLFGSALAMQAGLSDAAIYAGPRSVAIRGLDVALQGTANWWAPLDRPALSIDQRIKVSDWIEQFTLAGGDFRVEDIRPSRLDVLAASSDLVVVATGKADLSQVFVTDRSRTRYDRPQRTSAVTYVRRTAANTTDSIRLHMSPGVGEFFTFPGVTTSGDCQMLVFEGVSGGPMDAWANVSTPDAHLERGMELLRRHFPDEAERFHGAELTDAGAVLRGRVAPIVRRPVGELPSGAVVMGLGDAVILNDPLTGQGSNNATIAAEHYFEAIIRRGRLPFDRSWMTETFEEYWRAWAQWSTIWTNDLLSGLRPEQERLFAEAGRHPSLAAAIAAGFDDPRTLFPWWSDARAAEAFVEDRAADEEAVFDLRDFRRALGQFATGVTVVTTLNPHGDNVGVTANSFASVSMDPPLVLWCPGRHLRSLGDFERATHYAINVLASDQHPLSRQFASAATDKFQGVPVTEGIAGVPLIADAIATFECRTVARHDAGDHVIYIGEVERYSYRPDSPLVFHGGGYRDTAPHASALPAE